MPFIYQWFVLCYSDEKSVILMGKDGIVISRQQRCMCLPIHF